MVPIASLWLPILLSAVIVFFVSFVIHSVLRWHRADHAKLPNEDAVRGVLRGVTPGDYFTPYSTSPADFKDPAFVEKTKVGPIAVVTILPSPPAPIAKNLGFWFVYAIVVTAFAAYIAGRSLGPGAPYSQVFRFVGATSFIGYSLALPQASIWFGKGWGSTLRSMLDGLVYGMLTGGTFGWLWPD